MYSLFLIASFLILGLVITDLLFADDTLHELMLRNQSNNSVFYVRQIKMSTGGYYWKCFNYENCEINKQVKGVSTITRDNQVTVYFQGEDSMYEVLAFSAPVYDYDAVYSLPLSFPLMPQ